jgi:hypothetical protein
MIPYGQKIYPRCARSNFRRFGLQNSISEAEEPHFPFGETCPTRRTSNAWDGG